MIPTFLRFGARLLKGGSLVALVGSCLLSGTAFAQNYRLKVTIDASHPGPAIPANFVGLSVSSLSIDGNSGYTRCFTARNAQMVNLFKQIGVKHLRTIMGKANPRYPDPSGSQIDAFFDFAAAAGVKKVIWSLHLFNAGKAATSWSNNKAIATHIWTTTTPSGTVERDLLESFAFDNEPDWLRYIRSADPVITGYSTPVNEGYIDEWRQWRESIRAGAVAPGANFSGPDAGSKWPAGQARGEINTSIHGVPFTRRFAMDAGPRLITATQHYYGASSRGLAAEEMAESCLSPGWVTNDYVALYGGSLAGGADWPTNRAGAPLPYRFTECSAFNNGGGNPGNQIFATALWALDFYHWWAQHECIGVNPFTRTAQFNSPIYFDGTNYVAEPYAYALKAFSLGSTGCVLKPPQLALENPSNINVTAYGVVNPTDLWVTLINKTFNNVGAHTVEVSIPAPVGFEVNRARYIVLSAGKVAGGAGDATLKGACLGGAELPNDGSSWAGRWTTLPVSGGGVQLTLLPTTALIVDLQHFPSKQAGEQRLSFPAAQSRLR